MWPLKQIKGNKKRYFCIKVVVLAILATICKADVQLEGIIERTHAMNLINKAKANETQIPAYCAVSYIQKQQSEFQITKHYLKTKEGDTYARLDVTEYQKTKKIKTITYISNTNGIYKIEGKSIDKIPQLPKFHRPLPSDLAHEFKQSQANQYEMIKNTTYFGNETDTITITSREPPSPHRIEQDASPYKYIYIINKNPQFILAWYAYSKEGTELASVTIQELTTPSTIAKELFEIVRN